MTKEPTNKRFTDGEGTCPFTDAKLKKLEGLLANQFEKEKGSPACCSPIRCPLTGQRVCACGTWFTTAKVISRGVCFCASGPHLLCPEHSVNCICYWEGDFPDDFDDLLLKELKLRAVDFPSEEE
jgi:hypothetical protein